MPYVGDQEAEVKCPLCGKMLWVFDSGSASLTMGQHINPKTGEECERSHTIAPKTGKTKPYRPNEKK